MVKSVLGVNHQGLKSWVIQRVSAILMTIYVFGLVGFILCHTDLSFSDWRDLFATTWMKVATLIFILALLYHAWIGIWTVFTDYVKCYILRAFLNSVVLLMLFASFFWGVLILWSV